MLLSKFQDWARKTATTHNWSLDLLMTERDGVIVSCEAWFCEKTPERADTGQGYWRIDPATEVIDCVTF